MYCIEMYVFCSRSSHSIVVKGVRSVIVNGCSSTSSIDLRGLYVVEWWELRRSGGEHHTGWMQILSRTFSSLQLVLFLPHLETCRVWKTEMVLMLYDLETHCVWIVNNYKYGSIMYGVHLFILSCTGFLIMSQHYFKIVVSDS